MPIYTSRVAAVLFITYSHPVIAMLLQDIRAKMHESRVRCHAWLTGYTTAMKTGTDIPVLAHPPYVSIKRDYVLTWVYCISCGMICSSFMAMT